MANLPWLRHRKKDIPGDLWQRCPSCDSTVFNKDLDERLKTCPKCNFHFPLSSHLRIAPILRHGRAPGIGSGERSAEENYGASGSGTAAEKMRSASSSVSVDPMSYHVPGSRHVKTGVRG